MTVLILQRIKANWIRVSSGNQQSMIWT